MMASFAPSCRNVAFRFTIHNQGGGKVARGCGAELEVAMPTVFLRRGGFTCSCLLVGLQFLTGPAFDRRKSQR